MARQVGRVPEIFSQDKKYIDTKSAEAEVPSPFGLNGAIEWYPSCHFPGIQGDCLSKSVGVVGVCVLLSERLLRFLSIFWENIEIIDF